jgi:hypothetical protein
MAGRMINGAAALAELIRPASDADEAGVHRVLPVLPELSGLLPGRGLRRGSTVAVATGPSASASGGTSLLLALLSAASRAGSWCAVVGVPGLGALAAAESGIALDRLALVPNPGPEWPTVVAALIDGVDVVVAAVPGPVSASIAGRLVARARQRGSVLVPFGHWAGADVTLQVMNGMWDGLGRGHGRLCRREVTITARGRGAAARPREATLWMPGLTTPPPIDPPPAAVLPAALRDEGGSSTSRGGRGGVLVSGGASVTAIGRGAPVVGRGGAAAPPGRGGVSGFVPVAGRDSAAVRAAVRDGVSDSVSAAGWDGAVVPAASRRGVAVALAGRGGASVPAAGRGDAAVVLADGNDVPAAVPTGRSGSRRRRTALSAVG